MEGLILSGGYGTWLRPIMYSPQEQQLILATKILFYAIEDIVEIGINEIKILGNVLT